MRTCRCPMCGSEQLEIAISQWARVQFYGDGGHEVLDTFGDLEWLDRSRAVCPTPGCTWEGRLEECVTEDTP